MTTLQQQIHQLAIQLEQLASQLEEPMKNQEIDLEKLVLEARQRSFQFHPAAKYDEYVKSLYLKMLLSILTYTEQEQEERLRLIARIFIGFEMPENFSTYLYKSQMITIEQFSRFSQILNENKLTKSFLIDALMVIGIQQEKKASQYIAEITSTLNINETDLKTVCQLAIGILQVDSKNIEGIIGKSPDLRFAVVHYLHAIESPCNPVLFVIGTGTEKIKVNNLKNKTNIHLENVCIMFNDGIELESLEKLHLINCKIESKMLSFKLKNVEDINLDNVTFDSIEKVKQIIIQNSSKVTLRNLQVKNCSIYNQYLIKVQNATSLTFENNYFEKNKFYVTRANLKETLLKLENIKQLQENHNITKNSVVYQENSFSSIFGKRSTPQYDKSHAITKIISQK